MNLPVSEELAKDDETLAAARELQRTALTPQIKEAADFLVEILEGHRAKWLAQQGITEPTCGCSLIDVLEGHGCSEALLKAAV